MLNFSLNFLPLFLFQTESDEWKMGDGNRTADNHPQKDTRMLESIGAEKRNQSILRLNNDYN